MKNSSVAKPAASVATGRFSTERRNADSADQCRSERIGLLVGNDLRQSAPIRFIRVSFSPYDEASTGQRATYPAVPSLGRVDIQKWVARVVPTRVAPRQEAFGGIVR